jgi:heme iron utilization protein
MERCRSIYFIDQPFFGARSCSVQFVNEEGGVMFTIFVGRHEDRALRPDQVARFEALRGKYRQAA